MTFSSISRPMNDSLFPTFLKNSGSIRSNTPREPNKKEGRIIPPGGKQYSAKYKKNMNHLIFM